VGEGGGVAVFGQSTNGGVQHYILEWNGPEDRYKSTTNKALGFRNQKGK